MLQELPKVGRGEQKAAREAGAEDTGGFACSSSSCFQLN